jgi:hypothetical protein
MLHRNVDGYLKKGVFGKHFISLQFLAPERAGTGALTLSPAHAGQPWSAMCHPERKHFVQNFILLK